WESAAGAGPVKSGLLSVAQLLDDPAARRAALDGGAAEKAYFALWSEAFEDATAATASAARLLGDPDPERRFVAAYLLEQLDLPSALRELARALGDEDLRIVAFAAERLARSTCIGESAAELFARATRAVRRLPGGKKKLKPIVWPWCEFTVNRNS